MLHAQMKTTTVNSGGRTTARPRISDRRKGSKTLAGLAVGYAVGIDMARRFRDQNDCNLQPCLAAPRAPADDLFYVFATHSVAVRKNRAYRNVRK